MIGNIPPYPSKDVPLKVDILLFLFEQEMKMNDDDVVDWSTDKLLEIFEVHKGE